MSKLFVHAALLAATVAMLPAAAAAQEINPLVRERIGVSAVPPVQPVRVQVGVNFFMPGPSGDSDEANKLRERARRSVYEMANHECELLEQIMAKSCRLESITVNVNRQQMMGQLEGVNANGNFTMQITPK